MPTSPYFNNQAAIREQFLVEDLIIESIRNHGVDMFYIPRESQSSLDELFGDDPVKTFTKAYVIDVYLETFNDFEGNQEFFSKFGLEIQKTGKVTIARRTFNKLIPSSVRTVPQEGDLIWMPIQQKLMEIKFVEEEKNFFQLGKKAPYMFNINMEAFKYNGELIKTDIPEIDAIADARAFGIEFTLQAGGTGTYDQHEIVYQGVDVANSAALAYVSNFDKPSLKLTLRNIRGTFVNGVAIKGTTNPLTSYNLASGDKMDDAHSLFDDNARIQAESENIVDFTENNPFGEP